MLASILIIVGCALATFIGIMAMVFIKAKLLNAHIDKSCYQEAALAAVASAVAAFLFPHIAVIITVAYLLTIAVLEIITHFGGVFFDKRAAARQEATAAAA